MYQAGLALAYHMSQQFVFSYTISATGPIVIDQAFVWGYSEDTRDLEEISSSATVTSSMLFPVWDPLDSKQRTYISGLMPVVLLYDCFWVGDSGLIHCRV